jgi:vacuolar protein-sorting-associated protein 4
LQYVFFGANGLVVLQASTGIVWSENADEKIQSALEFAESKGSLDRSTALSPWRQDHFFVNPLGATGKLSVPDGLGLDQPIIDAMLKGEALPKGILDAWKEGVVYDPVPGVLSSGRVLGRLTDKKLVCCHCNKMLDFGMHCYFCNLCMQKDLDLCIDCHRTHETSCRHERVECVIIQKTLVLESHPAQGPVKVQQAGSTTTYTKNEPTNEQGEPDEMDKLSRKYQKQMLKDSLTSSILVEKHSVKWSDVAGLQAAKDDLQEAIVFPTRFPQMYTGKRKPRRGILLYGPPGTGKTFLAKAVSTEVDHTLFRISSGDVMSKWFGESEGLVRSLFELAREKKPSIIFIDEIDALCGHRDGGDGSSNEHTARMKTELLVQMDGLGNDNSGVFVLAATNLPWMLDPALRRRFQKRIHIPLPDFDARVSLLRNQLTGMLRKITVSDLTWLGQKTENFSGSDLATALQDALMVPVKRVQTATHFQKVWFRVPTYSLLLICLVDMG